MQIPKEEVRENILAAAREEFLLNRYENGSIRTIAAKAKTSKSNLYHYFADKDALFCAVVEPTVQKVRELFAQLQVANSQKSAAGYTMDAQRQIMTVFGGLLLGHREDFLLLFYKSAGSSLSSFQSEITDALADVLGGWVAAAAPNAKLSKLFLRSVAGLYVSGMEQMLRANVTGEQATAHMMEFLPFVYGGWKDILQPKEME